MALIDKRFVHFKTRAKFNEALAANEIDSDSVVFIKDEKRVWTHGEFFTPASFSKVIDKDGNGFEANDIYQAISFLAGNGLDVTVSNDGKITYSHSDTSNVASVTAVNGKFINSITFDGFGHVTAIGTAEIEQNTYTGIVAGSADAVEGTKAALANGNVHINITEQEAFGDETVASSIKIQGKDNLEVTATAAGVIEVSHNKAAEVQKTKGSEPTTNSVDVLSAAGTDAYGHLVSLGTLPVPTKKYVDDKLAEMGQAVDTALILRGVLGTGEGMVSLPADAHIGDVYKVGTAGTYDGHVCQVGDVLIRVEGAWVVVQANTDIATASILGLVKGGYSGSESKREFAVQITATGEMFVEVPFEYTNKSTSVVTNKADGKANAAATNGNVRINHLETSKNAEGQETTAVKSSINIKGSDATSVTADANGVITVESHDTQFGLSVTESAKNKVITFTKDNAKIGEFTIDAWEERD